LVEAFADAAALLLGGRVATAFLFALSRHTNLAAVLRRTDAGSTVLVLLAFRPGPTGTTSLDPHHGIITDLTPLAGSMGRRPVGFPGLRADPFEAALPAKLPLCAVIVPLTHGVDRIRQARGYGAFTGAGPITETGSTRAELIGVLLRQGDAFGGTSRHVTAVTDGLRDDGARAIAEITGPTAALIAVE